MGSMKKLEWKIEKRKVRDLIPANYNPRKLTDKQKDELTDSIKKFGQVEPGVMNTNGTLIGGHQRAKIYADLGTGEMDVMIPNRKLTEKEEKELNLRLNKNTGEWELSNHGGDRVKILNTTKLYRPALEKASKIPEKKR